MSSPFIRSLTHLQETGSTSRILNLSAVWKRCRDRPEYWEKPLFQHPTLNRSLLMKHTLRGSETDLFYGVRRTATKLLVPMDHSSLRNGGCSFFIGQRGYDALLKELFGANSDTYDQDRRLLELLDTIPSFDPFLMREHLRRHGLEPARCYLDVSDADALRMHAFVKAEVRPLITAAFGDLEVASGLSAFAAKIMATEVDAELGHLQSALALDDAQYQEGVFCWKGFLYYKWSLGEMLPGVVEALDQLAALELAGGPSSAKLIMLSDLRAAIRRTVSDNMRTIKSALKVYDEAYAKLTKQGRPSAFREFLLGAPELFETLGAALSVLNHFDSFWRFRFRPGGARSGRGARAALTTDELLRALSELHQGLGGDPLAPSMAA